MGVFKGMFGGKKAETKDSVGAALDDLLSDDELVRKSAAEKLVTLGLASDDIRLRLACVDMLAEVAENQTSEEVQWEIESRSLNSLPYQTREFVTSTISGLSSTRDNVRKDAEKMLKKLPSQSREAIRVMATLEGKAERCRRRRVEALRVLGEIGRTGSRLEAIIPVLIRSLGQSYDISQQAKKAIMKIAAPAEIENFREYSWRYLSIPSVLKVLDLENRCVVEALIDSISCKNADVRDGVITTLSNARRLSREALPALLKVLGDGIATERVAEALGEIGEPAIQPLTTALRTGDNPTKERAALALGMIGKKDSRVLPDLIEGLKDEHPSVREAVAKAIGEIGSPAKIAVPSLISCLGTIFAALEALGKIGDARAIEPILERIYANHREGSTVGIQWLKNALVNLLARSTLTPEAVLALMDCFKKVEELRDGDMIKALGKTGDARVIEAILEWVYAVPRPEGIKDLKASEDALLSLAAHSTLTPEVASAAIKASSFSGERSYGDISPTDKAALDRAASDRALETLCSIDSPVTSNILHYITKKKDVWISIDSGCVEYPKHAKLSFAAQRQTASEELERRGSPAYDPRVFLVSSNRKAKTLTCQSANAKE